MVPIPFASFSPLALYVVNQIFESGPTVTPTGVYLDSLAGSANFVVLPDGVILVSVALPEKADTQILPSAPVVK